MLHVMVRLVFMLHLLASAFGGRGILTLWVVIFREACHDKASQLENPQVGIHMIPKR